MKPHPRLTAAAFAVCFLLCSAFTSFADSKTVTDMKNVPVSKKHRSRKALPDLVVSIDATAALTAGDKIPSCKVTIKNIGKRTARGTQSAGNDGYMVDMTLSSDGNIPMVLANYSPGFHEDVLLQGGRISNTPDLKPGQSRTFSLSGVLSIPADTPGGAYCIGGFVDSAKKIGESNERNNTTCRRVKIAARPQARPFQVISPGMSQDFQIAGNHIRIKVLFNKPVKRATLSPRSNFRVQTEKDPNAAGAITWVDSRTLIWTSTKAIGDLLTFDPDGFFKLIILDSVKDTGDTRLDGDKNGVEGGNFTNNFTLLG